MKDRIMDEKITETGANQTQAATSEQQKGTAGDAADAKVENGSATDQGTKEEKSEAESVTSADKKTEAENAKSETAASAAKEETKKSEKKAPPKHKMTIIDVFLAVTGVLFLLCAFGMTCADYQEIARIAGLFFVFVFVCGAMYATLHLKKVG